MATLSNDEVQDTPQSAQFHFIIFVSCISALPGLAKPPLVLMAQIQLLCIFAKQPHLLRHLGEVKLSSLVRGQAVLPSWWREPGGTFVWSWRLVVIGSWFFWGCFLCEYVAL